MHGPGSCITAAATATGVLKAQIIALQAAMTMGLSLAITGIIELISRLISRSHEAADAIAQKTPGDREAKKKAVYAAMPKFAGPFIDEATALRKELAAERVPEAIAGDKDALLKHIDRMIDFLKKMSK